MQSFKKTLNLQTVNYTLKQVNFVAIVQTQLDPIDDNKP